MMRTILDSTDWLTRGNPGLAASDLLTGAGLVPHGFSLVGQTAKISMNALSNQIAES
jgi:hypothetical protein